eukprot:CAMPEP_0114497486 /NCGR_PEP_ID=MMETSP0109-20121206/6356_1 /TAXON_ID=29199 /ORGANISM="Chlorarachnion reptans, Strain CCCM449" /LENGTH=189 /DNA_ID=CAMNT_0001674883 /DNA_START=150 /DNA_END=719 /DNA_ORIENTATION=-
MYRHSDSSQAALCVSLATTAILAGLIYLHTDRNEPESGLASALQMRVAGRAVPAFRAKSPMGIASKISFPNRGKQTIAHFKFLKDMGMKKPDFLPDFGGPKKARLAAEWVENGFPDSGRAPSFTATIDGKPVQDDALQSAWEGVKGAASDFNAQPYDEETLERVVTFTVNGKQCNLKMTQEGKILSLQL